MSPQQVFGVLVWSTKLVNGQLVDYTYTTVKRASRLIAQVYYTLVDCNPQTLLLQFILDLSYKLFLHRYAAAGMIFFLTHRVARSSPSAVAELLVMHATRGHRSIFLRRRCNTLCTSN